MSDKSYAEIRTELVKLRGSDKPDTLKAHAEVLISTIDYIHQHGEDDENRRAFHENYARFVKVAGHQ